MAKHALVGLCALLLACPSSPDKDREDTSIDETDETDDTDDTDTDSGEPPEPCVVTDPNGTDLCIFVDSSTQHPVPPHFNGFNVNLYNNGLQYWDERLVERARMLTPGTLKWGMAYALDWKLGWIPDDHLAWFANNTNKHQSLSSYQQTIKGNGYAKLAEFNRFAQETGARLVIVLNTHTDDAASAGELATMMIERGYDVAIWELDSEPFYWADGNSEPQRYDGGYGYAQDMKAYFDAIKAAYDSAGLPVPFLNLSTSDGGETTRQAKFDGMDLADGYDPATDALGIAGYGSPDDPDPTHTKYWTGWSHHWYPGHNSYIEPDGTEINYDDETEAARHWEILKEDVTHRLVNDAVGLVDEYFLPVNGPAGLQDTPAAGFLGAITEYNLRFKVDYTDSAWSAVHAAESVLRFSTHERLFQVGYHALSAEAIDYHCLNRQDAISAGNQNRVLDTRDNDYDFYWDMPGLALQLVNRAVNTADSRLETTLEGGVLAQATEAVYAHSEAAGKWGFLQEDPTEVPAVYAQTYRDRDGVDRLVITNRSAEAHSVGLTVDAVPLRGSIPTWTVSADDALFENDGADIDCDTGITDAVVDKEIVETEQEIPLTLPPHSVVMVDLFHELIEGTPDSPNITLTPGPHSLQVDWSAVDGATSYQVSWGVAETTFPFTREVTDPGFTITPYLDGIDLYVVVRALNAAGPGAISEERTAQTLPKYVAEDDFSAVATDYTADDGTPTADDWEAGCGGTTTWSSDGDTLSAAYLVTGKHCLLQTGSSANYQRVKARLKLSEWQAGETTQRIGLIGRYQDDTRYVLGLLDHERGNARIFVFDPSLPNGWDLVSRSYDFDLTALEGEWFTLELEMDDQTLRLWMGEGADRRLIIAGLDEFNGVALTGAGKAGVFARRQAMEFDDFQVR